MYCIYIKKRVKGIYCANKRAYIDFKECSGCSYKEYKKVSKKDIKMQIKPISKKRVFVSKETYNKVFERDNGCCRLCGKSQNLCLHHIIYRSKSKALIDVPSNCIMLCMECHLLVHSNKRKYQPILLEIVKKEY